MILVITQPDDRYAQGVVAKLRARGADVLVVDQADFPSALEASLWFVPDAPVRRTLRVGAETIDLGGITAAWNHAPRAARPAAAITDPRVRDYVACESRDFLRDLWSLLDCTWLPAPTHVLERAQLKARQLELARRVGLAIPETLIGNRPDAFLAMYRDHAGRLVSKASGPVAFHGALGDTLHRYTERVTPRQLVDADSVALAPVTFQAYVAKHLELRVTVVDDRAFTAAIHSQATERTRDDWRRYDHRHTPYTVHALPAEIEQRCVALARALEVRYGAIDLVLTPDGEHVFLELNPAGQCAWIEDATGLPISDAIADALIRGGR